MKRRAVSLLAAVLLMATLNGCKTPRPEPSEAPLDGHISAFSMKSGHAWAGFSIKTVYTEGDTVYAKLTSESGILFDDMQEEAEDWEKTVALTDEESAAFDELILNTLCLPNWEERYDDLTFTEQDSWSITYTWDGKEYLTSGYAIFPDGLSQIRDFFASLDWPEKP